MQDALETYKVAIEIGKMYIMVLQFFIAVCSLFGGWIVVNGLPRGASVRTLFAITFLAPTVSLLFALTNLSKRAEAAIFLAREAAERNGLELDGRAFAMFRIESDSPYPPYDLIGMGAVIIGIVALILLAKEYQSKPKEQEANIPAQLAEVAVVCHRQGIEREDALASFAAYYDAADATSRANPPLRDVRS